MSVKVVVGKDFHQSWELWRWDIENRRATMYTPSEPYGRYAMTITAPTRTALTEMEKTAEARAREKGYVTFPELSDEAQAFWAEHDANWLINDIVHHLENR